MYVLKDLWCGRITPSERQFRENGEYARLTREAIETMETFIKELSPVGRKAFDTYETQESKLDDIAECDSFIRGFRLGAGMILDVILPYESPMPQIREKEAQ